MLMFKKKKTECRSERGEIKKSPVISTHISENANTPLIFKRTAEKKKKNRRSFCASAASKSNLGLLGVGTEVLKQDVVVRSKSTVDFYLKICYL